MSELSVDRECHECVTRDGIDAPCERPAIGYRLDEEGNPYPVCNRHLRAPYWMTARDTSAIVGRHVAAALRDAVEDPSARLSGPRRRECDLAARQGQANRGGAVSKETESSLVDRSVLLYADLAFVEEPGTPSQKMLAALTAYEWAKRWHADEANLFGPSLNDWRAYRATLGSLL